MKPRALCIVVVAATLTAGSLGSGCAGGGEGAPSVGPVSDATVDVTADRTADRSSARGDADIDRDDGDSTAPEPWEIEGLFAAVNPGNTLSCYVFWTTPVPASTALDVDCGEGTATILGDGLRMDHEVFVMGLYPEAGCVFTARSEDGDGVAAEAETAFSVPSRPEALPPLELLVDGGEVVQPGWTLFNLTNKYEQSPPIAAVVDAVGRYRWYHVRATSATGSGTPVSRVSQGILIGGSNDGGITWPALVDWEGRLLWEEALAMHHEILLEAQGEELLYLGTTTECPDGIPDSGTIVRYAPGTDEVLWKWVFCEHFTPAEAKTDWDHTNALVPFPGEDAFLLSAKTLNGLFKIDVGTGEVLWRLGKGGDFVRVDGETTIPFLRQHAPEFLGEDEILLFDNGKDTVREKSGAVQLRFDEEAMTYEVTWSWYPDPPIFCHMWGDADRLGNGNTLMTFGRRNEENDSHLIEVTMDGDEVWHLKTPVKWGWYRADRIDPLPAGYVITE